MKARPLNLSDQGITAQTKSLRQHCCSLRYESYLWWYQHQGIFHWKMTLKFSPAFQEVSLDVFSLGLTVCLGNKIKQGLAKGLEASHQNHRVPLHLNCVQGFASYLKVVTQVRTSPLNSPCFKLVKVERMCRGFLSLFQNLIGPWQRRTENWTH